eukprot:TRINITY_DN9104_c0_g1_i1.p1 TRINITY_DN9104_c0_g1~~TRINITY_DN9104_c0_g1_i1.p1  ORF type:complete len:552 (+),score=114.01 TRINITY_DN9104_c0_g1_i1:93-1748(+)
MAKAERLVGTVRSFRGSWGFIVSDAFQGDIFVGLKGNPQLGGTLRQGEEVSFELVEQNGKTEAIDVQVLGLAGAGDSPRFEGRVRKFQSPWGFIESDAFEGDLFVGLKANPHLRESGLSQEDRVEFEIIRDPATGKSEAVHVRVLTSAHSGRRPAGAPALARTGPAERAQVSHLVGQMIRGTIKNFRDLWGFVVSDQFEGDLFIHMKANPDLGAVGPGDPVEFVVEQDKEKGFMAANTRVIVEDVSGLVGQKIRGTVRKFRGGWGFLTSPRFEGDIFCGSKANPQLELEPLEPGDVVEFEVADDRKSSNGVHAIRIEVLVPVPRLVPMVPVPIPTSRGLPLDFMAPEPIRAARRGRSASFLPSPDQLLGATVIGNVRSFRDNWGFVTSPMFDGDVFVGLKDNRHLPGLAEGEQVQFTIGVQQNGKCVALNVTVLPGGGAVGGPITPLVGGRIAAAGGRDRSRSRRRGRGGRRGGGGSRDLSQMVGSEQTGWIKSFKAGWGFVNSDAFDGDLFIGMKDNGHLGQEPNQGDRVSFTVGQQKNGKLQAVNVELR